MIYIKIKNKLIYICSDIFLESRRNRIAIEINPDKSITEIFRAYLASLFAINTNNQIISRISETENDKESNYTWQRFDDDTSDDKCARLKTILSFAPPSLSPSRRSRSNWTRAGVFPPSLGLRAEESNKNRASGTYNLHKINIYHLQERSP
jgi:hypothetical protein